MTMVAAATDGMDSTADGTKESNKRMKISGPCEGTRCWPDC
jgi:hypothetical protein